MANFAATFTKTYTNTCQTLTVTDVSNYGFSVNSEHYEKVDFPTKEVTLRDIFGNILQVENINPTTGTAVFDLTLLSFSSLYLDIALRLSGFTIGYETRVGGVLPCII